MQAVAASTAAAPDEGRVLDACAQIDTGYRLEVVTVRKLEFENDAFGFADKIVEKCAFTP